MAAKPRDDTVPTSLNMRTRLTSFSCDAAEAPGKQRTAIRSAVTSVSRCADLDRTMSGLHGDLQTQPDRTSECCSQGNAANSKVGGSKRRDLEQKFRAEQRP